MGKKNAKPVSDVELTTSEGEKVLLWKATMPLSDTEHEQLSNRLRFEEERSGVKIILIPYSIVPEVSVKESEDSPEKQEEVKLSEDVKDVKDSDNPDEKSKQEEEQITT